MRSVVHCNLQQKIWECHMALSFKKMKKMRYHFNTIINIKFGLFSHSETAQTVVDFISCKDIVLDFERIVEKIDTIVVSRSELNVQSVRTANIVMNDSMLMFGAMDGTLYSIEDGRRLHPFCEPAFNVAQFTGEPSVHPGSVQQDSNGQLCYARGNATVGSKRINFIKKQDFCTRI